MIVNRSGDADKPPPLEHAAESMSSDLIRGWTHTVTPGCKLRTGMLSLLKSITFVRFDWFNQNAS